MYKKGGFNYGEDEEAKLGEEDYSSGEIKEMPF